jgi:hypothetical protein
MAIAITKRVLSGSTHGVGIGISATQGGTPITVHALSTSATTTLDEIYIYAQNDYSETVDLILEWGQSATGAQIVTPIPARDGMTLVVPGLVLTGSACAISAFVAFNGSGSLAASSAFVSVFGYANRIVQS